jgi:hypothetical protein
LIIRVEAEEELGEAAGWYEQRRPGLGSDFVAAIESAMAATVEAPRPTHPGKRALRTGSTSSVAFPS